MSLQLATTEKFGDLDCNFYRNEIDFCEYSNDFSIKTGLMNPSTLDIIDINLELRKMFECTIDSILDKYKLKYSKEKRNTIFDEIN